MKKLFYYISVAALVLFAASCEKEEIGGTAVEALSGEWVVYIDGVDASGNVTEEDPFGVGASMVWTYNTSENKDNEMFVDDQGWFWEYQVKVNCDINAMTFSVSGAEDYYNGISIDITDGKVVEKGTVTPSGTPADAIEFCIVFSDDDYVGEYWDKLWVHGYRYTGLAADE